MRDTEIVIYLKKILGKYLREEGIYVFSKQNVLTLPQITVSIGPIESDVYGFTMYRGPKLFFFYNTQDVDVYVDILTAPSPSDTFVPIKSGIRVPSGEAKVAVTNGSTAFNYLKFRYSTLMPSSKGYIKTIVVRWS